MSKKNQKGFTLIEVIISMAIVSISLITLLTIFNRSLLSSGNNAILTRAVMLADERIALISLNLSTVSSGSWSEDTRYKGYSYREMAAPTLLRGAESITVSVRYGNKDIFELQNYRVKK